MGRAPPLGVPGLGRMHTLCHPSRGGGTVSPHRPQPKIQLIKNKHPKGRGDLLGRAQWQAPWGGGGGCPMKSRANSSIVRSVPSAPTRATGGSVTSSEHSPSPGVSSGAHRRPCGRVLRATLPATPNRKAHVAISGGSGSAGRQCALSHSGGWQPPLTPGWCHQEPGAESTSS